MRVKTRIHLLQFVIAAIVLLMAVVSYVSILTTDRHLKRVQWANHKLEAITSVNVQANRFSEQIAELLLIGEPERVDYVNASRDLEKGFARLEQITRDEAAYVVEDGEDAESSDEMYRLQRMRQLYTEIDHSVARLIVMRNEGRIEEAIQLFRNDIENRLDAEFEHLLRVAVLDDREEVMEADREAKALWWLLAWIVALATLAALAICLATGNRLSRALIRPVAQLIAGTDAIRRGELDHRIDYRGNDELGALAQGFNQMGAQLEEQRDQVRDAQSNLERQVADRTGALAAANERLSALDHLRAQFLADISHELRTPLTVLRGEAEITLRHAPKPEAEYREALERIVMLARDMSRLVDDLLFLARSETDTLRFELRPLALQDLLAKVKHEGQTLGRGKGIDVQIDCPDEPIWVAADAQRLKQALLIVLDNAIKYSPRGRAVDLRVLLVERFVEIAIRNGGHGIRAEEVPHVFDRFYRGQTSGGDGLGLGLAIAKWLLEKQGGDIALNSEADSFTEVRIRISRMDSP